jgi:hypothetical protein
MVRGEVKAAPAMLAMAGVVGVVPTSLAAHAAGGHTDEEQRVMEATVQRRGAARGYCVDCQCQMCYVG